MKAKNIKWDVTDGAEGMTKEDMDEILSTLPTEVEIPDYLKQMMKMIYWMIFLTGYQMNMDSAMTDLSQLISRYKQESMREIDLQEIAEIKL